MSNVIMHKALSHVAGRCDGAASEDGQGFAKFDSTFGKSLVSQSPDRWSAKQTHAAWRLCVKYRNQIERGLSIVVADIPEPVNPKEAEAAASKAYTESGATFDMAALKWSEARTVNTKNGVKQVRSAPITDAAFWVHWKAKGADLKAAGYSISKYGTDWQISEWKGVKEEPVVEAAPTLPADVIAEIEAVEIPSEITAKLFPFQIQSVKAMVHSLRKHNGALDASDLGSGKTFVMLAAAKVLGRECGVVCPKAVITSWKRAAAYMGVNLHFVINYEMVRRGTTPLGSWVKEGRSETFKWNIRKDVIIVADECQKAKNGASLNSKVLCGALDQGYMVAGVSATAAQNSMEMRFVGQITKLHSGKDFWPWMLRNGVVKGRFGLEFVGGRAALAVIHKQIFPDHGSRIRIADIPEFPECQTAAEVYSCNGNTELIDKTYKAMFDELAKLDAREDISPGARQGHVLAIMTFARQRVELLKVPAIVEMAEDYLENNHSVVIFTNFKETVDALCKHLKTTCFVDGRQTGPGGDAERQANIDAFQADRERVIIVNIQSGGAGLSLHDLNGNFPRAAIICPTWSALDLKQATGRIHRAGAKTKAIQRIFFASETIEEKICEKVKVKLANIATLVDGDLNPTDLF